MDKVEIEGRKGCLIQGLLMGDAHLLVIKYLKLVDSSSNLVCIEQTP